MKVSGLKTISAYTYKCDKSNRHFTFNSENKYQIKRGRNLPDTTTIKQLLEAGAHFGHQTGRWHHRIKNYIFTKRNGIHIIDLEKTAVMLDKARDFVRQLVADGGLGSPAGGSRSRRWTDPGERSTVLPGGHGPADGTAELERFFGPDRPRPSARAGRSVERTDGLLAGRVRRPPPA